MNDGKERESRGREIRREGDREQETERERWDDRDRKTVGIQRGRERGGGKEMERERERKGEKERGRREREREGGRERYWVRCCCVQPTCQRITELKTSSPCKAQYPTLSVLALATFIHFLFWKNIPEQGKGGWSTNDFQYA